MVWHGGHGVVWYSMAWYGIVWHGEVIVWWVVWNSTGIVRLVWCGIVCHGIVLYVGVVCGLTFFFLILHPRAPDVPRTIPSTMIANTETTAMITIDTANPLQLI